jgi:hypothetical protein
MLRAPGRLAWAIAILVPVLSSTAAVVPPGGSITDEDLEFTLPTGTRVAERATPFTITFTSNDGRSTDEVARGTLSNYVLRDDQGRLTFVYDIDVVEGDQGNINEGALLRARGFAGFETDVDGDFESVFSVTRSADGSELVMRGLNEGLMQAPTLVVRTDATAFNENGTLVYEVADEFPFPPDGEFQIGEGSFTFEGTFQPADDPVVIPLPPAAATGLAGLGALAAIRAARSARRVCGRR